MNEHKVGTQGGTRFERRVCTRCGGSGHYSYNTMHGSVCYGCGGQGVQLTKTGKAAARLMDELLTVPAEEIKVGDVIETSTLFGGTRNQIVTKVSRNGRGELVIESGTKYPMASVGFTTVKRADLASRKAALEAALAQQAAEIARRRGGKKHAQAQAQEVAS